MPKIGAYVLLLGVTLLQLSLQVFGDAASQEASSDNAASTHISISTASSPSSVAVAASSAPSPVATPSSPASSPSASSHASTPTTTSQSGPSAPYVTPSLCPSRTINWITHTLPQQCVKTSRTPLAADALDKKDAPFEGPWALRTEAGGSIGFYVVPTPAANTSTTVAAAEPTQTSPTAAEAEKAAETEAEADSPLDNANFLSFEEWKKLNLEKVGQSPENVGQGRGAAGAREGRRRPVHIDTALDSLGEDVEIELDFGGFGDAAKGADGAAWPSAHRAATSTGKGDESTESVTPGSRTRSKDAGKTCKERFNYASFDCAATVLKTNKQAKSSSSILVENKDSYMLNECSAENKFLIVELCDDILIDTVVLANFEFFSSIFRTFRVSVSDRYPVKMERWRELGTFEARNTREIQAFLVEEPMIWARYLRVEFLNHYGSEYYCPLSLLRVHGTTMMEEFRHQEEVARGEDDDTEPIEEAAGEVVEALTTVAEPQVPAPKTEEVAEVHVVSSDPPPSKVGQPDPNAQVPADPPTQEAGHIVAGQMAESSSISISVPQPQESSSTVPVAAQDSTTSQASHEETPASPSASCLSVTRQNGTLSVVTKAVAMGPETSQLASRKGSASASDSEHGSQESPATTENSATTDADSPSSTSGSSVAPDPAPSQEQTQTQAQQAQPTSRTPTTPPHPNPTTQESFFKSIHKRLQALESNSTLSLQYIEEQSRILRDAFAKVEKRQLQKTEKFLQHINETVIEELKGFRQMYDLLWQSTVLEVEGLRETHGREMLAVTERLSILAEEVVWQKRMAVVQSTLLLLCLALVLFVKSGVGGGLEVPVVQQMMSQPWARGVAGRMGFESPTPPHSPPRNGWGFGGLKGSRSEINLRTNATSDTDGETDGREDRDDRPSSVNSMPVRLIVEPPSPPATEQGSREPSQEPDPVIRRVQLNDRTMSGPATPTGTRDKNAHFREGSDMDDGEEGNQAERTPLADVKREEYASSPEYLGKHAEVGLNGGDGRHLIREGDISEDSSGPGDDGDIMDLEFAD